MKRHTADNIKDWLLVAAVVVLVGWALFSGCRAPDYTGLRVGVSQPLDDVVSNGSGRGGVRAFGAIELGLDGGERREAREAQLEEVRTRKEREHIQTELARAKSVHDGQTSGTPFVGALDDVLKVTSRYKINPVYVLFVLAMLAGLVLWLRRRKVDDKRPKADADDDAAR